MLAAHGGGQPGQDERVVPADERSGLLGLVVVAEPHERGGAAADHGDRVVAQVPEQQRQRDAALLTCVGQPFQVVAGDLVGGGDHHGGHLRCC